MSGVVGNSRRHVFSCRGSIIEFFYLAPANNLTENTKPGSPNGGVK